MNYTSSPFLPLTGPGQITVCGGRQPKNHTWRDTCVGKGCRIKGEREGRGLAYYWGGNTASLKR